jgi:hypothetical protein
MNAAISSRSACALYAGFGFKTMSLDRALPGRVRETIMNTFPKITALAVAGMIALGSGARAASLYDDDDDKDLSYNRRSLSSYCYKHPYDEACDPNAKRRHYRDNGDDGSYTAGRCAPLVRAVGKRNLVLAFARNSARFSWSREARFVHGDQYANWYNARNAHISCMRVGGLSSCEATATPCR